MHEVEIGERIVVGVSRNGVEVVIIEYVVAGSQTAGYSPFAGQRSLVAAY